MAVLCVFVIVPKNRICPHETLRFQCQVDFFTSLQFLPVRIFMAIFSRFSSLTDEMDSKNMCSSQYILPVHMRALVCCVFILYLIFFLNCFYEIVRVFMPIALLIYQCELDNFLANSTFTWDLATSAHKNFRLGKSCKSSIIPVEIRPSSPQNRQLAGYLARECLRLIASW